LLPVDPKLKIKKSYLKLDVAVEVAPWYTRLYI